ncbi:hypothetical protein [Salinarchaeum sp. Harcht-Bsk1]|uniref:hypothetical protein n=1 Tax=Salinarchaeum sp. Harcht-Bsk1 TaxID=1333523 RepID=UPI0009DB892F|nr:hypothetical protein [Salinarchaeum sp. Harcht-Bsk1]
MSTGLSRYGVEAPTVVRAPTTDADGLKICPECGAPIGGTLGTQRIAHPTIRDDLEADELVTHGYRCNRHPSWVVLPSHPNELPDGWASVEIDLADGRSRPVPVPQAEVGTA